MTSTSTSLETVDQKLEYIVSIMVQMADEQSAFGREFRTEMVELKETVKQQAEVAKIQAESVRELVRLLNGKA